MDGISQKEIHNKNYRSSTSAADFQTNYYKHYDYLRSAFIVKITSVGINIDTENKI